MGALSVRGALSGLGGRGGGGRYPLEEAHIQAVVRGLHGAGEGGGPAVGRREQVGDELVVGGEGHGLRLVLAEQELGRSRHGAELRRRRSLGAVGCVWGR
jgi:hypothetical protein